MTSIISRCRRGFIGMGILLLVWGGHALRVQANPVPVANNPVAQGTATISGSGTPQVTINQTSANAFINWASFNIAAGETTTFNQPSSSSVTWNYINDPNASSINGNINAIGYVILQNPNGFSVGGQATITAHGLVMTTASTPALNLSSGGPWSFNAPPPTAKIVNYGQINITGGGQAYLIANDIENNGTISAPRGKIGLYTGQTVLVSTSPDGRGLSAQATIPQGLVDNNGNLTADAGSIALQAQTVNQNGVIQANSVKEVNGTIELVASDSINLGANSVISAQGDTQGTSPGGSVTIKSGNSFSDQVGSTINISGGSQGGNGGQAEISAPQMSAINSSINGQAADGFDGGILTIDPADIWLASANTDPAAPSGYSIINVNSFSGLSQISLQADNNIELNAFWILDDSANPAVLSLSAGNNITLNDGSGIQAGQNWSVNMTAGTQVTSKSQITSGNDGIYLNGSAFIQAVNGNASDPSLNTINLYAANEVIVGSGGITTIGGGNIQVTAEYGNVNSGTGTSGFNYADSAPYYTPSPALSGISTAAGGNVTINAGNDVFSFPAETVVYDPTTPWADPGTGAFGSEPGNVTINAGGSVYGHFVEVNGTGTINAGQNIGTALQNVALSLADPTTIGGWNLNAGWNPVTQTVQSGLGDIYLQEVRNPNGVFDNLTTNIRRKIVPTPGNHLFDYGPQAYVTLTAGDGVYLTGSSLPRPDDAVPLLLPPIVTINAGPGGVVLDTPTAWDGSKANDVSLSLNNAITLFPSPYQSLEITTTGGGWLSSGSANGTTLLMSDSGLKQWYNTASGGSAIQPFGPQDHASVPALLNNDEPVSINLTGSQMVNGVPILAGMENITLQTDKATQINVAGDMIDCSFYGENLQASGPASVTSINVGGQIYNVGSFTQVILNDKWPKLPLADTPPTPPQGTSLSSWYLALALAVDPNNPVFSQSFSSQSQAASTLSLANPYLFQSESFSTSLAYNPNTKTLTAIGPLSSDLVAALQSQTLRLVLYDSNGPKLDANGHIELDPTPFTWCGSANAALISTSSSFYTDSQKTVPPSETAGAYVVGGTGQFNVTAGSISLGNSRGILSVGCGGTLAKQFLGLNYSFLAPYIMSGATINVTVLDPQQTVNGQTEASLYMPASTIAALGGGGVTVSAPNGSMDLGSQELLPFEAQIMTANNLGLGIYTTGAGDVNVTALGTINVDSSRIATFDGGNINVESLTGDVNAGSGGTSLVPVNYFAPDYSGQPAETVPANGIVAGTLTAASSTAGSYIPPGAAQLPGNITIKVDQGNIYASAGGILQLAYDETLSSSASAVTITLIADGSPDLGQGNIVLGNSGVIGVNVVAKAAGTISGLIISQQNTDITSQGIGLLTVLAGRDVNINSGSGGSEPITIIAIGKVNDSGLGPTTTILSSSINGGAGTLATSSSASSTGQSAAGQTSAENQQQVASNSEPEKKKKKKEELVRTVGRVTVVLPKAS